MYHISYNDMCNMHVHMRTYKNDITLFATMFAYVFFVTCMF